MKIVISVGGRFHAFFLARQLLKRNALKEIITSYPRFWARRYGLPPEKVKPVISKEILFRSWQKLPVSLRSLYDIRFFVSDLFDRRAAKIVSECDLFIGWSSFSLRTLRRAKELGAITIIQRGSSHIIYQRDILRREYEKLGLAPDLPADKIIEKELQEYEEADYIEVPSTFARRTFLEKGFSASRIIQGGRGVDLSLFRPVPKEDNIFRIIYAGQISIQKGIHYLLQAFSELRLSRAELWLIGSISDSMKPFLKKYTGNYTWLGHKPEKELYRFYSQGSVFVIPTLQEGLAMVQVQAMACGLPVISTTNSGGEDIIDEGKEGFIIPICDLDSLKERLSYLYQNQEICREMGAAALAKAKDKFSWDDYGDVIIEKYRRIVAQGARVPAEWSSKKCE
jgi:glycosyltransferase involved in cell wall biosynthesis